MNKPDPTIFLEPTVMANIRATVWMIAFVEEEIAERKARMATGTMSARCMQWAEDKNVLDELFVKQQRADLAELTNAKLTQENET